MGQTFGADLKLGSVTPKTNAKKNMWINFDQMPSHARVWVYQANRELTTQEVTGIQQFLKNQISDWAAHGAALLGSATLLYNRFAVVAVDETQNLPSGCSIDASTRWFKEIEAQTGLSFFDRSIAFLQDDHVETVEMLKGKQAVNEGLIAVDTTVFNPMVTTMADFRTNWQVPAHQSWLKKYFLKLVTT